MVGVPGRSKGCKTCRRRKKGCDLKQPECTQCTERGLTCGGYDRDRIFIYQSAPHGTKQGQSRSPERNDQALATRKANTNLDLLQLLLQGHATQPTRIDVALPHSLARSAFVERIIDAYLEAYLPSDGANKALMLREGLPSVLPQLTVRDDALKSTIIAIYAAVTGFSKGDKDLMEQGKRMYGQSLQDLNRALKDRSKAGDETLLAVPRLMGLFEILFGADYNIYQQGRSWQSHTDGDVALMEVRGPDAFSDGIPHSLFTVGRLYPLISATSMRKATILNLPEWKTIPWKNKTKAPKDYLLDILAAIPEVLEALDDLTVAPEHERQIQIPLLDAKCQSIDKDLETWLSKNPNPILESDKEDLTPIEYPNMNVAHLTVIHCSIALQLYTTTLALDALQSTPQPSFFFPNIKPSKKNPRRYARIIARSVPYFFKATMGIWGAAMIAFPMGTAMSVLQGSEKEEDRACVGIIIKAWSNPQLPTAIKDFLISMREESLRKVAVRMAQRRVERSRGVGSVDL